MERQMRCLPVRIRERRAFLESLWINSEKYRNGWRTGSRQTQEGEGLAAFLIRIKKLLHISDTLHIIYEI